MSAILIQADDRSRKLLQELAKVKDDQIEDLMLGVMMDQEKTGETVPRERIMKKLESSSS